MTILIVSVDHRKQYTQPKDRIEIPDDNEDMEPLRAVVRGLTSRIGIDLICEESDPTVLSIAQEEAFFHDPRIHWKNIMMTAQERLEADIWCAILQSNRPMEVDPNTGTTVYCRVPEDHIREDFFRAEIIKYALEFDAKSVLVLCGDAHTESLKSKLESSGYHVETSHDLISVKDWR